MSAPPALHWSRLWNGAPTGALYGYPDEEPTESDDGRPYRYALHRAWNVARPPEIWVMCNPSTATALVLDATLRRVRSYSHDWDAGGFVVVNMLAYRSTDPRPLRGLGKAAIGRWNDAAIDAAFAIAAGGTRRVVCAWGSVFATNYAAHRERIAAVTELATRHAVALTCLDASKDGHPVHPLRQPSERRPRPWSSPAMAPAS